MRAAFNEGNRAAPARPPSDEALFERDSPIRRVHADVVAMTIGGMRSLFLQMLHPHALQGVLDFSDFRADMAGRLSRTAHFITDTTFQHRDVALAAVARVNRIHAGVRGTLPDGTAYAASDPRTLAWVHVAGATSFLAAYLRHARPDMPIGEQDEYFRQFAVVARALGADPVPSDRREAEAIFHALRADLQGSAAAREVAQVVLAARPPGAPPALQAALGTEAVALLPPFARAMLGLGRPGLEAVPARALAWGMGKTLRWALRQ